VLDLRVLLGLRIEELRTALHLSREQLAERVGIDARQIANYELYGAWPEPEKLADLIRGLSVEIHDLFDFTENRKCPRLSFDERLANRRQRSGRGLVRRTDRPTDQS
jgi:transcriptional regulator with XRE-family HTH domain